MNTSRDNAPGQDTVLESYLCELLDDSATSLTDVSGCVGAPQAHASVPGSSGEPETRFWLFAAAGLTLAIPESRLLDHVPVPGDGVSRNAASPYFETLLDGKVVRVIDSAGLVRPRNQCGESRSLPDTAKFLIRLDDGGVAISGESAPRMERLDRSAVCWRSANGKRAWMAGALRSHGCVILDVDGIRTLSGLA